MADEKKIEEKRELTQEELEKLSAGAKSCTCPKCMCKSYYPDANYCWTCGYRK